MEIHEVQLTEKLLKLYLIPLIPERLHSTYIHRPKILMLLILETGMAGNGIVPLFALKRWQERW